jgi:ADP-heptose:LPS heptosyltransferase
MLTDCRHFTGSVPCEFHKLDGRACASCTEYERTAIRILIVKLAAAGDVLRTTCILPAVREAWPGSEITWITEAPAVPLLDGNEFIDRIIARDRALERLLVERFDVCLGLDPDADGGSLAALAQCGERRGFVLNDRGWVVPVNESAGLWWRMGLDDEVKRANRRTYADLVHEICGLPYSGARPQIFIPPAARRSIRARFAARLEGFTRVILLNTGGGARFRMKRWTFDHYVQFARTARSREPLTALLVVGGPEQAVDNARLLAGTASDPGIVDAGCANSIKEFAAIVEMSDLVVTSDSLALHIANALSRPVVALVGPTSPWELDASGAGRILTADVPCLACYRRDCDLPVTCMDLLSPETVYAACAPATLARLPAE